MLRCFRARLLVACVTAALMATAAVLLDNPLSAIKLILGLSTPLVCSAGGGNAGAAWAKGIGGVVAAFMVNHMLIEDILGDSPGIHPLH